MARHQIKNKAHFNKESRLANQYVELNQSNNHKKNFDVQCDRDDGLCYHSTK